MWCSRWVKIERFSFEYRAVIGFTSTKLHDWLEKLAPLFHPIRNNTKLIVTHVRSFSSATCFEFWLVHWINCVLCDWPEWLLWFYLKQENIFLKMFTWTLTRRLHCILQNTETQSAPHCRHVHRESHALLLLGILKGESKSSCKKLLIMSLQHHQFKQSLKSSIFLEKSLKAILSCAAHLFI